MSKKQGKKLTEKQERFIREYLIDFNATRAAKAAGYKENTAYQIGHENLSKPEIQEAIQKEIEKRNKRTEKKQDRAVEMIEEIAEIDFSDYEKRRNIRGIELLAKHRGLLLDRKKLELQDGPGNISGIQITLVKPGEKDLDEED